MNVPKRLDINSISFYYTNKGYFKYKVENRVPTDEAGGGPRLLSP